MRTLLTTILILIKACTWTDARIQPPQFTPQHQQYIDQFTPIPQIQPIINLKHQYLPPHILGLTRQIKPNHYLILINPKGPHQTQTIQHELVHVKQMYTGELSLNHTTWLWKGDTINWETPYRIRPWEQEAFRVADSLFFSD